MTFTRENPRPASPLGDDEVISVSVLNRMARTVLEGHFPLCWVAGEISNLTRAASGHVYFSLKDEGAQVRCTLFRNRAQLLPFRLTEGMQVEVRALVTLYEPRGDFQLNVEALRRAGVGALYEAFLRLREKLEREGLFAPGHKKPLPRFPRCVGVVTSLQAAALQDILAAMARRAPCLPVIIYPTPVQGEGVAQQIAAAIGAAAARGECDVLIVARGGGSIEDLWCFNEEAVARAIHACAIPVVSGVGHESDTTIADFVADRRAATPTAAAELVTAGYCEAAQRLGALGQSLRRAWRRQLEARMQRVDLAARRLIHPGERLARLRAHLEHLHARLKGSAGRRFEQARTAAAQAGLRLRHARPHIARHRERLETLACRLPAAARTALGNKRTALAGLGVNLAHLNPHAVLQRGYSIVRDATGAIVRDRRQLQPGQSIRVDFARGWARADVTDCGDT
ncbi:MAG: exodeoxyribonuclease VII large subunit [Pseudomonadota bacterium]